ncbi:hypothetical protein JCM8097_003290 [Rhodosporidiobolus ruineniae]
MDLPIPLDPALAGGAPEPGSALAGAPAIDPALDPQFSSSTVADAALQVAIDNQDDQPRAVADTDSADDRLKRLRTSYKAAAVSHFCHLFLHHLGETFDTEAFEEDLSNNDDDKFLPQFLGRILNTLANDRNTNHSNWLNALRRSYNRRVSDRRDNPFYTWVKVPASVVEAERALEREKEDQEWLERYGEIYHVGADGEVGDGPRAIWDDEEKKLREAERALGRKKKGLSAADGDVKPQVVHEAGAADVNMATSAAEAGVPVTEEALDDGFNAEMADVVARDAAGEGVKKEEDEGADEESEEWYEEQRAVEWNDLPLETKLDAIYNVCEWHMVDPERQFRKYLQWDGEAAWRLDPIGRDASGNKYYHLADDRLWVQRPAPPPNPAQPSSADTDAGEVQKPRTLLGLKAGPRDKSKKGTVTGTVRVKLKKDKLTGQFTQVVEDEEQEHDPLASSPEKQTVDLPVQLPEDVVAAGAKREGEEEAVEMPEWEKAYWEERARVENTPGFVEWEALCVTLDDWRAFPARFAGSTDPDEIALRDKIAVEIVPTIEQETARRAAEREEELAALALKRSSRLAEQASLDDEASRLAAEKLDAANSRYFRSTRGASRANYAEDQFGVAAASSAMAKAGSGSQAGGGAAGTPVTESREERLKKREEEKRRAEEEQAAQEAAALWEQQREDAIAANGGVVPFEYMTEDERAQWERAQEKERKKREAEDKKRQQEDKKKQRAKERRAELKAERDAELAEQREAEEAAAQAQAARAAQAQAQAQAAAQAQAYALPDPTAVVGAADDPWWMDCEICGLCGWNVDDGQELICCDECEEWQHLPCHAAADAQAGRPPQPFHDEAYQWMCGRCQGVIVRTPRPPVPNPPNAPLQVPSAAFQQPLKRRASDSGARGSKSAAKKPKAAKQPNGGAPASSIPYGHGAHPLYHPSAYSHPVAVQNQAYTASPSAPAAPAPAPVAQEAPAADAPMSYDQLKSMVEANPALISQLPEAYQAHFRSLGLGA